MLCHNERWVDVAFSDSMYQVSTLGRVRSIIRTIKINKKKGIVLHQKRIKILSQKPSPSGYPQLTVRHKGESRQVGVHRLVAEAFVQNPTDKITVNDIDGHKLKQ